MEPRRVLLVGASVRGIAFSTIRAGCEPIAIDRFGDADLDACCPTSSYDADADFGGLIEATRRFPELPLVYGGPFENEPTTIERIATGRPLWGNPPEVLRCVRSPSLVATALRRDGLPTPGHLRTTIDLAARRELAHQADAIGRRHGDRPAAWTTERLRRPRPLLSGADRRQADLGDLHRECRFHPA